jgi:hypothetical protein
MFQPQRDVGFNGNEVDQYLSIDIVKSSGFIDILSWWSARKESLPGHYCHGLRYFLIFLAMSWPKIFLDTFGNIMA